MDVTEPTSAPAGTTALIETAYDTWSDVADRADRLLQTVGMATADLVLLRRIGGPPGRRRVDLAAAIRRTPSQTVRAVAPWVKLGYVLRTAEHGFVLTQDGAAVVAEASLLLDRHLRLDGPAPTDDRR